LATILMVAALILSFIPIMPGPVLVWGVATLFAAANNFHRMTVPAVIVATAFMVIGSTSDLWLKLFGVRTGGLSCLAAVGGFLGGLAGTFIPIPVVGTMIGAVVGSALVEMLRLGELREAYRAGRIALKMILIGYVVQLVASIAIFAVYVVSVQSTSPTI
jgi:uncharacterized protein YqgC (DUF456 family)